MINLKEYSHHHLERTFEWMQDDELRKSFLFRRKIDWKNHLEWYEKIKNDNTVSNFAIYYDQNYVGNVGLKNIDHIKQTGETWIYLGNKDFRGKNIAYKAYEKFNNGIIASKANFLSYCFIASFNNPSLNLYLKLGYIQDENYCKNGMYNSTPYKLFKFNKLLAP